MVRNFSSQQEFQNWLWAETQNDRDKFTGQYPKMAFQLPQVPRWFTSIPHKAPKWICTLHESITLMPAYPHPPNNHGQCCPHSLVAIQPHQPFIAIWHKGHEFTKPFESEIAELLGQTGDPNGYIFAEKRITSPDYLTIQKMKHNQILQPIPAALQQAHKQGFVGSFRHYDEIILHLAQNASHELSEQHNKLFERYEKCRNLALGSAEVNERHLAALRAYEVGRKLIDQLLSAVNQPVADHLNGWRRSYFHTYCRACDTAGLPAVYVHSDGRIRCVDCIKNQRSSSPPPQHRCHQCGRSPNNTTLNLHISRKSGQVLCTRCIMNLPHDIYSQFIK